MKLLVFGEIGQLGQELQRRAGDVTLEVRGLEEANFTDPDTCAAFVTDTDADAVINAVAYTAVDKAEEDEDLALQINGTTPGAIARAAAARGLPLVHISTDYVFDGAGQTPFATDHPTAPLNAYGRTKLVGEQAVLAAGGTHVILRTSWVFSAHGQNFVKTMLRLSETRDALQIVDDQIGGPTAAGDIADAAIAIAERFCCNEGKPGIYHFSGAPDVSWAEFAREIFAQAGRSVEITGIPTKEYPTPAQRPLNSRLDCRALQDEFGVSRPDWRTSLKDVLQEVHQI